MTLPLFAAVENEVVALIVTVATLGGGGVTWLVNFIANRHDKLRGEQKQDETERKTERAKAENDLIAHMNELAKRSNQEINELRSEVRLLREELTVLTGHVFYVEGIMDREGIDFRHWEQRWRDHQAAGDGSGPHKPLGGVNPVIRKANSVPRTPPTPQEGETTP